MKSMAVRLLERLEKLSEARKDLNGFTIITNQTKKSDMILPGMVYDSKEEAMKAAKKMVDQRLLPKEEWRIVPVVNGERDM